MDGTRIIQAAPPPVLTSVRAAKRRNPSQGASQGHVANGNAGPARSLGAQGSPSPKMA